MRFFLYTVAPDPLLKHLVIELNRPDHENRYPDQYTDRIQKNSTVDREFTSQVSVVPSLNRIHRAVVERGTCQNRDTHQTEKSILRSRFLISTLKIIEKFEQSLDVKHLKTLSMNFRSDPLLKRLIMARWIRFKLGTTLTYEVSSRSTVKFFGSDQCIDQDIDFRDRAD